MTFVTWNPRLERRREPCAYLDRKGKLRINAHGSRIFGLMAAPWVVLSYDAGGKLIGLDPRSEPGPSTIAITNRGEPGDLTHDQGVNICMKGFCKDNGIDLARPTSCSVRAGAEGEPPVVVDLGNGTHPPLTPAEIFALHGIRKAIDDALDNVSVARAPAFAIVKNGSGYLVRLTGLGEPDVVATVRRHPARGLLLYGRGRGSIAIPGTK